MNKDLTVGKPESVLWRFCLPLFGSIIFQQLYNLADSFVAGKFVGESALAAVGNSYEITLIFIAFAFGCNENALLFPGSIVPFQYRRGYPLCDGLQNGRGRCSLGNLPVPGSQLRAGAGCGVPAVSDH